MIIFDVFDGISDQYFVEKFRQIFAKKKLSEIFVRVPPLEFTWNLMLPENDVDTSKCQCATTAKGPPFWIATFFEIP